MLEGSTQKKKYREILVRPLAARREALALIVAISLIILLMGLRFSFLTSAGGDARESLRTYQIRDMNLKNQAPILYRALLGVVRDILDLREENGNWPDVDLLINEALPPFANNFLPIGLRGFVWERHAKEGWVDYFGVNGDVGSEELESADPLENSFILRLIDLQSKEHPHPHPGKDNDPVIRFSSQIWVNPHVTDYPAEALVERGWKWIVNSGASQNRKAGAVISEKPGQ